MRGMLHKEPEERRIVVGIMKQKMSKKEYNQRWREKKLAEDPDYFRKRNNEWIHNNPEKAKANIERYKKRHPGKLKESKLQYKKEHPRKNRAMVYAQRHTPLKDHCERCGAKNLKLVRHHPDYSKPLEVLTLCPACHKQIHREIKPVVAKVPIVHCDNCAKTYPECGKGRRTLHGRSCVLGIPKKGKCFEV